LKKTAFRSEPQGEFISFASVELLWKVFTPKRWAIIRAMTGQDEMTIRAIAEAVDRDIKAVHSDVQALLNAGVLNRTDAGHVIFPYEAVHVDFTVTQAA
jgi:predicted transcriptional regulator